MTNNNGLMVDLLLTFLQKKFEDFFAQYFLYFLNGSEFDE